MRSWQYRLVLRPGRDQVDDHCEFSMCGSDQRWSTRMTTLCEFIASLVCSQCQ